MKNYIYLFVAFFLLSFSSESNKIKGDLYFKRVDISSSEGMTKEQAEILKYNLHNYKTKDSLSISDLELVNYFKLLEKNNLLELPFIYLKKEDKAQKIFLSKKEYEKVKSFTLSDLNARGKKVIIELKYEAKENDIYYSNNIISIQETDGETPSHK